MANEFKKGQYISLPNVTRNETLVTEDQVDKSRNFKVGTYTLNKIKQNVSLTNALEFECFITNMTNSGTVQGRSVGVFTSSGTTIVSLSVSNSFFFHFKMIRDSKTSNVWQYQCFYNTEYKGNTTMKTKWTTSPKSSSPLYPLCFTYGTTTISTNIISLSHFYVTVLGSSATASATFAYVTH